jgi:hypothetical protein
MAVQDFETLRARVQAVGCQLFIDDADDGDPRMYIHDPKVDKHVIVGAPADEIESWIVEREDAKPKPGPATLLRIENEIAHELDDINLAIAQTDLHEQEGAADKLPKILALAKSLADEINELGNFEHSNRGAAKHKKVSADDKVPDVLRAAAERLAALEERSKEVPLDEVLKFLNGCNFAIRREVVDGVGHVDDSPAVDGGDFTYQIGHDEWTETGVRHTWAEQKLIWALRGVSDGGAA